MCIEFIQRHIRMLPARQIFTTSELLIYGTRTAVDSALSRMVQSEVIVRLARGVFVRDDSAEPTLAEIVSAKAKAYGREVIEHPEMSRHGANKASKSGDSTFTTNGHSSSFWTVRGRAHLHGVCAKRFQLGKTAVGQVIAALWRRGKSLCTTADVRLASSHFGRSEREQFWLAAKSMPAWLTALCRQRFPAIRISITKAPNRPQATKNLQTPPTCGAIRVIHAEEQPSQPPKMVRTSLRTDVERRGFTNFTALRC